MPRDRPAGRGPARGSGAASGGRRAGCGSGPAVGGPHRTRTALVLPGDGYSFEEALVMKRAAGAVACSVDDLEVLVAGDDPPPDLPAARLFPAARSPAVASPALDGRGAAGCPACAAEFAAALRGLPSVMQDRCVAEQGGMSPALQDHLSQTPYDVVVFGGYRFASTVFGMASLPSSTRAVLVPCAAPCALLELPVYDPVFARPDALIAVSAEEADLVARRSGAPERVTDVGFAVRIDDELVATRPGRLPPEPYFLCVADPADPSGAAVLRGGLALLASHAPRLRMVVAGFDPEPPVPWMRWIYRPCTARADMWRLMAGAAAVVDFAPSRLLGLALVEGMLSGRPVVVPAGGAAQSLAERAGAGLWFRDSAHLQAALEFLAEDPAAAGALGAAGRRYASAAFGDPDAFIASVGRALPAAVA